MKLLVLVVLLAYGSESKAIRDRRAILDVSNFNTPRAPLPPDVKKANEAEIVSYQTTLTELLKQINLLESRAQNREDPTPEDVANAYQMEYYKQAAAQVAEKLLNFGAVGSIIDAQEAASHTDDDENNDPVISIETVGDKTQPKENDTASSEEELTDDQARDMIRIMIDDLMAKFYSDIQNTKVYVLENGRNRELGDSSSSSSEEEDSDEDDYYYYYYGDSDEDAYEEYPEEVEEEEEYEYDSEEEGDDSVMIVNQKVSTNMIRIPSSVFVDTITKLMSNQKPAIQGTQLTPVQIEDASVYTKNGEIATERKRPEHASPPPHLPHVVPTLDAATASASPTLASEIHQYAFGLSNILLCMVAILIGLWILAQIYTLYRNRREPTLPMVHPEPVKAVPTITPNIYSTPPATRVHRDEKPPGYVENVTETEPKV